MTRQDNTWQDTTKQDKTGQDYTIQEKTRQDQWKSRHNKTRQDRTRQDKTRQDKTDVRCFSWSLRFPITACGKYTTDPFFLLNWNLAHTSYNCRRRFYFVGPGIWIAESGKLDEIWCDNYLPQDLLFTPDGLVILADAPTHGKFLHLLAKKIKLFLRWEKSCRMPPNRVLMRQSHLCFFAARTFYLPLTLIFSRLRHLSSLPLAHGFPQEAQTCRVHMLFYPTQNIHPASGNEVSSHSQNLAVVFLFFWGGHSVTWNFWDKN